MRMKSRFSTLVAVLACVLLFGTCLPLWACGEEPPVDAETIAPTLSTVVVTTAASPEPAPAAYVSVLHPYHNTFLDAPTYLIPENITLAHPLPEFPESVPAQRITSEPLPDTDLPLVSKPVATGHYLWFGLGGDLSPSDAPLSSQDVAAQVARAFLEEHGLWNDSYAAPQVRVGSSETGPGGTSVTSWAVRFDREPVAAGLERYVSARVGGRDEVIQLTLAIPQLEPVEGKLVRLRPLGEVIADTEAWQAGDSGALQNEIQGEVAVEVQSVFLAYADPGSGDEPLAVPVYRFEVEVCGPEGEATKVGFWSVVAAADVVEDPKELGTVTAPRTTVAGAETTTPRASYTTSSIVSRSDGSFLSLSPEDLDSAVVEIPAYPDQGETRRVSVDLGDGDRRQELSRLLNSLKVSPEPAVEPMVRISLHVTLESGREFYVIWFDGYPLLFKDFVDGEMVTYEAVESAEMSAFLAQYH